MQDKIAAFKAHVTEASANPKFVHHKWFVKWHLEVVEKIAKDLLAHYPQADADLVEVMVWLHDYGKILELEDNQAQYDRTVTAGRTKLTELGFSPEFVERAVSNVETMDKKMEIDLNKASIEVQIVSSADGCSHMVGPFMHLFWHEATDQTFTGRTVDELMAGNLRKADKDWTRKITLPEARKAFEARYQYMRELSGELPAHFL